MHSETMNNLTRLFKILALSVLGTLLGCAPPDLSVDETSAESTLSAPAALDVIQFRTDPELSVEDLLSTLTFSNSMLARVETVYVMGDRTWYDTIYSPTSTTPEELKKEIFQVRRDMWRDQLEDDDWTEDEIEQYQKEKQFCFVMHKEDHLRHFIQTKSVSKNLMC